MKIKTDEIRQLEIPDIKQKIQAFEKELYDLRRMAQASRVEKPNTFGELKKSIAICKTVIREKEIANARK